MYDTGDKGFHLSYDACDKGFYPLYNACVRATALYRLFGDHRDRPSRSNTTESLVARRHTRARARIECGVALDRAKVPPKKSEDFQEPT